MSNKKLPTAQEEHEEKVDQVTDMITAEDLVEQAVYTANAPKCCSEEQRADNMLGMLGANVMDGSIYHKEEDHPHEKSAEKPTVKIQAYNKEWNLIPEVAVLVVPDFMGTKQHNIGLNLYCESEDGLEPFATLTKNFGEFIGLKNCAYVDLNNCPFATQLLEQGVAVDTGLTKQSGFCTYPLWQFNEEFLKSADSKLYELYSQKYDEYMESMNPSEDESPDLKM